MTDASPPGADPQRTSRRLKYALIASLALNLLIIGVVAGSMFGKKHHHRHSRGEHFGLMGLSRMLPEERRKEVRKQLYADRAKLQPLMEDIRASRRQVADKLTVEPFDRAVLDAAISEVTEKEQALRQAAIGAFLDLTQSLTAEERKLLAERWRKKSKSRHGPPHKEHPAGD